MTIIGLKELRQNATQIAERVAKGESFTVVKRSKPVFNITPPTPQPDGNNLSNTVDWTEKFVKKHQPAFDELSEK